MPHEREAMGSNPFATNAFFTKPSNFASFGFKKYGGKNEPLSRAAKDIDWPILALSLKMILSELSKQL